MPPTEPPGLQSERTTLAWSRSGLAALVLAGVLLKAGISRHDLADLIGCTVALAAAVVLQLTGMVRQAQPGRHLIAPTSRLMRTLSACCVLAISAATAALFSNLI